MSVYETKTILILFIFMFVFLCVCVPAFLSVTTNCFLHQRNAGLPFIGQMLMLVSVCNAIPFVLFRASPCSLLFYAASHHLCACTGPGKTDKRLRFNGAGDGLGCIHWHNSWRNPK